jgi:GNAT superfamily N-acetyltransferase
MLTALDQNKADTILEVWNEAAQFDSLSANLLHEKIWGDANFDPLLAIAWRDDSGICGFAVGVCRRTNDSCTGYIKLLAVAPGRQRQGIGTKLYQALENQLRARGACEVRPGESAPNYLTPGVDSRYHSAIAFFENRGFERCGETCNMTVDLENWWQTYGEGTEQVDRDDSIRYERATTGHRQAVRQFIDQHWPSWWSEVSVALANEPATLHLAIEGDRVVGFAAHDANNRGTGWFGPMGTAASQRGKGIGGHLLACCLADMRRSGLKAATIPWVGPVNFYLQQAGATVTRTFLRYNKVLQPQATR